MRIAAAGWSQPQRLAGVYGKAIFTIGAGTITDFDPIDQIKHGPLYGHLERQWSGFLTAGEVGSKRPPERVGHDHGPASIGDDLPELFSLSDARNVLLKPVDEDVAEIGADLHAAQKQKIVFGRQIAYEETVPALIVLSDHDTIQAESFGFLDEFHGV
jgi:hypothetical protein